MMFATRNPKPQSQTDSNPDQPDPQYDFVPRATFERALSLWWLLVIVTLMGGVTAWAIHFFRPPLYDATAIVIGNINFTETGQIEEYQLDYALNSLHYIINSTSVKEAVLAEIDANGLDLGSYGYRPYLERKSSRWILRVRHPDPQIAAKVANIWLDASLRQIDEAYEHALRAHELNTYLTTLETCLTRAETQSINGVSCGLGAQAQLQAAMASTVAELNVELEASRTLTAALVYTLETRAEVPRTPIRYGLNSMLLAGGLIGLIIGIWAIHIDLPRRLAQTFRHA
jgi:uncharacterized protein involved in exopolysaccharide biosynthesis